MVEAVPTEDGHHVVIKGRKWRATDPGIPPKLKQELVNELMSARRAVKNNEEDARPRVSDAKNALGERGRPWWEPAEPGDNDERIAATIRCLLRARGGEKTVCPSEVARIIGGDQNEERWRGLMPGVRDVAGRLVGEGWAVITQRGEVVDLDGVRGPIRIRRVMGSSGKASAATSAKKEQPSRPRKRKSRSTSPEGRSNDHSNRHLRVAILDQTLPASRRVLGAEHDSSS